MEISLFTVVGGWAAYEKMCRVITESLSLARSLVIRSLVLEVEAVIVKDLFVMAVS